MKINDVTLMSQMHEMHLERCDKCNAKAKHEVTLVNGLTLLFCKDHWEAVGKNIPGARARSLAGMRR
jgi:hypothetical protein